MRSSSLDTKTDKQSTDINFRQLVQSYPDSFLAQYMHVLSYGETAECYDFWTGLWLISTLLGRNVVIPRPISPVRMNWYIVLCSDSGVTRKSTAVNYARNLAMIANARMPLVEQFGLIESKATPEGFERLLSERYEAHGQANVAVAVSEMIRFFGRETYSLALPGVMTDLYDCPDRRTIPQSRTQTEYHNVYVTFLSASTPRWLSRAINPDVTEGGFTSRAVFITADAPKQRTAWASSTADDSHLSDLLLETINRAREVGEIRPSAAALNLFTEWYASPPSATSAYVASFTSREADHVLRLAACLGINNGSFFIDEVTMRYAIRVIRAARLDGMLLFDQGKGVDRRYHGTNRAIELITNAGPGGIKHTDLYRRCRHLLTKDDLIDILEAMLELGMVDRYEPVMRGRGRQPTIWRGARPLLSDAQRDQLFERIAE
jgi:hypothetical protein